MMMDLESIAPVDLTWQSAYAAPYIDITMFHHEDPTSNKAMIVAWLRRQTIWAEYDGTIIGYRYAPIAVGQEIMNLIHRSLVETFNDDNAELNKLIMFVYASYEYWIENKITKPVGKNTFGFVPALIQPDLDEIKYVEFPQSVNLGDCIMPNDQQDMIVNRTFDNIVNLDRYIVNAIIFDNNVIFVMGKSPNEVIYINKLLQNEFIHCMFVDEYMNVLAVQTYSLRKEEELWSQRLPSTPTL